MKTIKILLLTICALFLTGCADIKVTTIFDANGAGSRTFTVYLSNEDVEEYSQYMGGIDEVLEQAKPEIVTINKTEKEQGIEYIFSYTFDSLEDYKEKTSQITGINHESELKVEDSPLLKNIYFKEDNINARLMEWAVSAIEDYTSKYIYTYNLEIENDFIINGVEVPAKQSYFYTSIEQNISPKVEAVNIYTQFNDKNIISKKIEVVFNKDDYSKLNMDGVLGLLKKYSSNFKTDDNTSSIYIDLEDQYDIVNFIKKSCKDPEYIDVNYSVEESSIFKQGQLIYEDYDLTNFLKEFNYKGYINNYVKVPDGSSDTYKRSNHWDKIQPVANYNIAEAFLIGNMYFEYNGVKEVLIEDVITKVNLDSKLSGDIVTTIAFNKNGTNISKEDIESIYKDYNPVVKDNGETITIIFTEKVVKGKSLYNNGNVVLFEKSSSSTLFNNVYNLSIINSVYSFVPETFNPEVDYFINVSDKVKLIRANIGDFSYYNNQLEKTLHNGNYNFEHSTYSGKGCIATLSYEANNSLIAILALLICLTALSVFCIILSNKKRVRIVEN